MAPSVRIQYQPTISEIEAPPGFRTVSMSQAMMLYARPVMEYLDKGVVSDPNEALGVATALWNHEITQRRPDPAIDDNTLIDLIATTLKMNDTEARDFFTMMLERKRYLLPAEIQPMSPLRMFVRKEKHYDVTGFDYESLNLSEEPYTPSDDDRELVRRIELVDKYIADDTDYGVWEDEYFKMQEHCKERFANWLEIKGAGVHSDGFPMHAGVYLNFIYAYMHDDYVDLKSVTFNYVEEFFADYLLRKVMLEPDEYVQSPPALKLFYRFLHDVRYLENPSRLVKLLDRMEPDFVAILQKRYS